MGDKKAKGFDGGGAAGFYGAPCQGGRGHYGHDSGGG